MLKFSGIDPIASLQYAIISLTKIDCIINGYCNCNTSNKTFLIEEVWKLSLVYPLLQNSSKYKLKLISNQFKRSSRRKTQNVEKFKVAALSDMHVSSISLVSKRKHSCEAHEKNKNSSVKILTKGQNNRT